MEREEFKRERETKRAREKAGERETMPKKTENIAERMQFYVFRDRIVP